MTLFALYTYCPIHRPTCGEEYGHQNGMKCKWIRARMKQNISDGTCYEAKIGLATIHSSVQTGILADLLSAELCLWQWSN